MSTFVDPSFPARLRAIREQRGLSLRQLATQAYVAKSTLSELENGRRRPSAEMARHLDTALEAGGALAALVTEVRAEGEDGDRIAHGIARPERVDQATVEALAGVLAAQRRADDVMPAHALLPAVGPQHETVTRMARAARGPHAAQLQRVAAEWTQFRGWLHAESRQDATAVRWLRQALDEADELDHGPLICQAADFEGWVARHGGRTRAVVRHCLTAFHTPGAVPLQRAINAGHAAAALAQLGDRAQARRLLGEAERLADAADTAPGAAYWLTGGFVRLGLGVAWLALDEPATAGELLRAGLDGLPDGWADAEWAAEYRQALETASR